MSGSLGRAGAVVASGTLVSRVLGFVNALLLYNTIGTVGQGADAFALANQLPNNIYAIVAGGTLTAVIVPAIIRATGHEDGGERFLNRLVTLSLALFAVIAIAVTVAAPLLVHLYAQTGGDGSRGFSEPQLALAYAFAYWCLPQVFFYAMFAILSEITNARGVFWPYAWAPVVNNVVFAAVLVAFRLAFGSADGLAAADWTPSMIVLLAGGATLGIAVQAFTLVLAWRRTGIRFRPDFRLRGVGLGAVGRLWAWTFGMVLVGQAVGILESNVASQATGSASIATLGVAWLVFMLPYSVATLSILVPYFTRMSRHATQGDRAALGADLTSATTNAMLVLVFAEIGLAVMAPGIAEVFSSSAEGVRAVLLVLSAYLLGLVPFSVTLIVQRTFFALQDTRTPFWLQTGQAVVTAAGLIGVLFAPTDAIGPLVALVVSLANWATAIASIVVARRRVPEFDVARVASRFGWFLLAMVPAAAAGFATGLGVGGTWILTHAGPWWFALLDCTAMGVVMAVVYALALLLTRNPELRAVARPLLRRLRRRDAADAPPSGPAE